MGKRLIQQARGKGGPKYRAPSFNYSGKIGYANIFTSAKGEVIDLINCAGHSAPLMKILYEDGSIALIPAPLGIRKGAAVALGAEADLATGNILPLGNIPSGTPVFNIEATPFDRGKFVRTSGTAAHIVNQESGLVVVKLPSKKIIKLNVNCRATIGVISGGARTEKPIVKGGKAHIIKRSRGKLHPVVSGVAMNAQDHKFGGTHRRTKGRPTTTSRNAPPGRKVGLIAAKKTGRGK